VPLQLLVGSASARDPFSGSLPGIAQLPQHHSG
jgi:hypothetical protein